MKILALAGSNSPQSLNKELVAYAAQLTGLPFTLVDMTAYDDIPLYSSLRQQRDGFPPEIEALYALIQAHDGILIASPEHNGLMPAVFKNVIDWLSRIQMKFLGQKPVLLMSTSPGPNGGNTNLQTLAGLVPWWGAQLIGTYSLGRFAERMQNGRLVQPEQEKLQMLLHQFVAALEKPSLSKAA